MAHGMSGRGKSGSSVMSLKPMRETSYGPVIASQDGTPPVPTCDGTGSTGGHVPRVVSRPVQLIQPTTHRDLVSAPQPCRELHLALLSSLESLLGTPAGSS